MRLKETVHLFRFERAWLKRPCRSYAEATLEFSRRKVSPACAGEKFHEKSRQGEPWRLFSSSQSGEGLKLKLALAELLATAS
jgi:hypothetical protein